MASSLNRQRDYGWMAEQYSKLNEPQIKPGRELLTVLNIKPGSKVLDMGCGTGELTAYIGQLVGEEGEVIGVDPDEERIKVAINKHEKSNVHFLAGDCSRPFPHHNEPYYDMFIANFVFLWLNPQEKTQFIQAAMSCLKPGGILGMQNQEENPDIFGAIVEILPENEVEKNKTPFQLIPKSDIAKLLVKGGFQMVSNDYAIFDYLFENVNAYLAWYCASGYVDDKVIVSERKEDFKKKFAQENGKISLNFQFCRSVAMKPNNL